MNNKHSCGGDIRPVSFNSLDPVAHFVCTKCRKQFKQRKRRRKTMIHVDVTLVDTRVIATEAEDPETGTYLRCEIYDAPSGRHATLCLTHDEFALAMALGLSTTGDGPIFGLDLSQNEVYQSLDRKFHAVRLTPEVAAAAKVGQNLFRFIP